jgi:hypothetical protein
MTEFESKLRSLRNVLGRYRARRRFPFADMFAHAYLRDVVEFSRATAQLAKSRAPRTAYSAARVAFEAAQDLAYLCSVVAEYEGRAALAYVFELVELEELQERFARADKAAGYSRGRVRLDRTPEQIVEADAQAYERRSPGQGRLLRDALVAARKRGRARRHWSGLSRNELGRRIGQEHPEISIVADLGDNFYGYLSVHTHPRLRWVYEPRSLARNSAIVVASRTVDRELPTDLADAAMTMAIAALTWIGRRVPRYEAP